MTTTSAEDSSVSASLFSKVPGLADLVELLRADAQLVDQSAIVPAGHFDAVARAGLYGAAAAREVGGLDLDFEEMCLLVELLASACLTTTFVWIQHFRLVRAACEGDAPRLLSTRRARLVSGELKGGISLTASLPGPPLLRALRRDDQWVLTGTSPWVSGWGIVNELVVSARTERDTVASFLCDATESPGLRATPLRLSAMNASATVTLTFEEFVVPADRLIDDTPYDSGPERPEGLRVNGSLALGVARRCLEILGPSALDDEIVLVRRTLDGAGIDEIGPARAAAAALGVRCAHALSVAHGSRSALWGDVAERSTREASLLLVFGSRPSIKRALLEELRGGS